MAALVGGHPRRIWIASTLLLFVAASFVLQLRVGGASQADVFLTDVDSVAGQEALAKHFPAGAGSPAVIIGPVEDLDRLVQAAQSLDSVDSVDSVSVTSEGPLGRRPESRVRSPGSSTDSWRSTPC